jgi:hypothetical protein
MLGLLGKQQKGLVRTVLPLFIVGCLNLTFQSGLMASSLNDCHDSSTSSRTDNLLSGHAGALDANCIHCPNSEPGTDELDNASLYICASMVACFDDGQPLAIVGADLKTGAASGSPLSQTVADPPAYQRHAQTEIGIPQSSLNIRYCRFLI